MRGDPASLIKNPLPSERRKRERLSTDLGTAKAARDESRCALDRQITLAFPREVIDNLADAVAERLRDSNGAEEQPEGWLAPQAAADYLGVSRRRVHDLTSLGALKPDGHDGRTPLFRRETLDRYARSESR
jgi:hypothetical protein